MSKYKDFASNLYLNSPISHNRICENFHENKEWFIYEGERSVIAVFEDNSKQSFNIHFRNNRGDDRHKWKTKAARTWKKLAMEIRKSSGLSEVGNPVIIPWKECFEKALQDPSMKEFIDDGSSTPIFEMYLHIPLKNIWLSPSGKVYSGGSHESIATTYLKSVGKPVDNTGYRTLYTQMYKLRFLRIIIGDNHHPLIVDGGNDAKPSMTSAQRKWIEDKSFDLGLNGKFSTAFGRTFYLQENYVLNEMSYDDLLSSMERFKTRKDKRLGTTTGTDGRAEKSQEVRVKPLQVVSTVGKDGEEKETALFSYKSQNHNNVPGVPRKGYQGFIKFLDEYSMGKEGDIQLNCNCFSSDAPILMGDGTYKPISEIKPGDFVYTHKGRIRPVIGNSSRKLKKGENVYKIKLSGFPFPIISTENHPFYILRGQPHCSCGCNKEFPPILRKSINPSFLINRKFLKNHGRNHFVENNNESIYKFVQLKNFNSREWGLSPWLEEGTGGTLNLQLCRFLGYYAAEGCLSKRSDVNFTFHLSELNTLGKDIINISKKLFSEGFGFRIPQRYNKTQGDIFKINRYDKPTNDRKQQCFSINFHILEEFKLFIKTHIGCGSRKKQLSKWFINLDNNSLREFLIGLFLGDGTIKKNGHIRWTSISHNLVFNVSTILRRLKIDHNITKCRDSLAIDFYNACSCRTIFDYLHPYLRENISNRLNTYNEKHEYCRDEGALKVFREIKKIRFNKEVWDLCVEEDESFIVAGVAVHNCPDYRFVWAKPNADAGAGITRSDKPVKPYAGFIGGTNDNNNTYGKGIRNPDRVPGLCKHLMALSEYLNTKVNSPVAPSSGEKKPSPVAPEKPKRPVNIFEQIKNFAKNNPSFTINYED